MIDDPNPLEEEIKQKNNRCNKVANDLLIGTQKHLAS
jgi:hypothetical protein